MPHDMTGQLIQQGDIVLVPCVVTHVTTGEEYCNLSLETVNKMYPGEYYTSITVNGSQAVLADESVSGWARGVRAAAAAAAAQKTAEEQPATAAVEPAPTTAPNGENTN